MRRRWVWRCLLRGGVSGPPCRNRNKGNNIISMKTPKAPVGNRCALRKMPFEATCQDDGAAGAPLDVSACRQKRMHAVALRNRLLPRPVMEKKDSPSGINPVGGAFSVASVVSTVPWKAGRAFRIISGNICCRVLRTLFRDEPRPGPFHGQCRGWHPDSAVWRV